MTFAERDDIPCAAGLESLGPLGSLASHGGQLWRIPRSGNPFAPRRAVPAADVQALRDAAELASEALLFVDPHVHAANRALLATWVERGFGPPRRVLSIDAAEDLVWFDGPLLMLLRDAYTLACATPEHVRALLACAPSGPLSLAPAAYSYGSLAARPTIGERLGTTSQLHAMFSESFELYGADEACWARGMLNGAFETERLIARGGLIKTAQRRPLPKSERVRRVAARLARSCRPARDMQR
jgi:hypothetical protein